MPDQTDPKFALKIVLDQHACQLYEATRAMRAATHAIIAPAAAPSALTPWADLTEVQRRTFIYDTADAVEDITSATLATGSRP